MNKILKYEPQRKNPIARFYYKGNHSHPVRRTVLVIESGRSHITGWELREGNTTRELTDAPIKTYNRSKVASPKQLRKENQLRRANAPTTYQRANLLDLLVLGV